MQYQHKADADAHATKEKALNVEFASLQTQLAKSTAAAADAQAALLQEKTALQMQLIDAQSASATLTAQVGFA